MKWTIDTGSMPSYLRVETFGEPSVEGLVAMWDEIINSDFWTPGTTVLMDNRKRHPFKDPDAITRAGIEYFVQNADKIGNSCISTICSFPEHYKYARQFQYGIRLRGSDVVIQVFGTESRALEWLRHFSHLHVPENQAAIAR